MLHFLKLFAKSLYSKWPPFTFRHPYILHHHPFFRVVKKHLERESQFFFKFFPFTPRILPGSESAWRFLPGFAKKKKKCGTETLKRTCTLLLLYVTFSFYFCPLPFILPRILIIVSEEYLQYHSKMTNDNAKNNLFYSKNSRSYKHGFSQNKVGSL